MQFYLGICTVLSVSSFFARIIHEALFYLLILLFLMLLLSKIRDFRACFQSGHNLSISSVSTCTRSCFYP